MACNEPLGAHVPDDWDAEGGGVAGAVAALLRALGYGNAFCSPPPARLCCEPIVLTQGALERMGLNAIRYARKAHRVYWDAVISKMELRPGVTALLDDLKQAGVRTAVCTDMLADIQMEKLEYLGLADRITYLVSSEEAGMDKPGAPIFWLALAKCGCLPGEAVMVGDNFRHDVQGATDVGIGGVWLNWTHLPRPEDSRAYTEVHDFEQAADYIRTLL